MTKHDVEQSRASSEKQRVLEVVRDQNGNEHVKYGRSENAIWISLTDFPADEKNVFARLNRIGVRCLTTAARNAVKQDLQNAPAARDGLVAARPGWLTDDIYVFANGTYFLGGGGNREIIIAFEPDKRFDPRGSHAEWKEKLGPIIKGQPLATFLLAYAFVGPLLRFAPPHLLNPWLSWWGLPNAGRRHTR